MNKRLLVSIGLSLATVWGLQYWWESRKAPVVSDGGSVKVQSQQEEVAGGALKVLAREDLLKPINSSVSFMPAENFQAEEIVVKTPLQTITLSTAGAVITTMAFNEYPGKDKQPLETINPAADEQSPVKGSFIVAFDDAAPYAYAVTDREDDDQKTTVTFQASVGEWLVNKTYTVFHDGYKIDVEIGLQPKSDREMAPIKPRLFMQAPFMVDRATLTAAPAKPAGEEITTFMLNEQTSKIEKKDAGAEAGYIWYWQGSNVLIGSQDKYFTHAVVADEGKFTARAYFHRFNASSVYAILEGAPVSQAKSWKISCYCGPKVPVQLEKVDKRLVDVVSSGWLSAISMWMLKFLDFIFGFVRNYGWAIIILTVLLRLPIVPLSIYARIKHDAYQKHAPIIARIRQKHKGDAMLQQQEILRYHKEHNLSPATSMIGCLPLLLQVPILYSLYSVLGGHIELYNSPFIGWITDLSIKDPYYVLPVLMGISMIWQQQMAVISDDKQRFVMFFVSIIMTIFFASFPAGLVLYWFTNNMLIVGEDYLRRAFFSR